ncbi:MAG: hypothetical protein HY736_03470 [Verrucomicrobia bacterium]|nr:hypothetical protein [Verrucomicrobiota bacterium]
MKRLVLPVAALVLALLAWLYFRPGLGRGTSGPTARNVAPSPAGKALSSSGTAGSARRAEPPLERSNLADALNSPATDIRADLRLVSEILDTFRSNFPREGNPVGTNAEITAVLAGRNKLRLALIPPEHSAINRSGELCDRWGTPFFFHAESAARMEIRSAGPDKKMWTADDVVFSP